MAVERATYENIVNMYLYGELETPSDLCDRLRDIPEDESVILNVDTVSYMQGIGRFALPALASIVGEFFSGSLSSSLGTTDAHGVTRLTVGELLIGNGNDRAKINFSVNQYITGTNRPDYGERAFIWGSTSYRLSNDTTFVWDNGSLRIDALSVVPYDDNFDFRSDDPFATVINPYLKEKIDPQSIGRTVDLVFSSASKDAWSGISVRQGYTSQNYAQELLENDANTNPFGIGVLEQKARELFYDLESKGIIEYVRDDKDIIYDSPREDIVVAPEGASIIVGGSGNDRITGSSYGDIIYGCSEDDVLLDGGSGDDEIYGEDGNDRILGGDGEDILEGGNGEDIILGGDKRDDIYGGDGKDVIDGGAGADFIFGEGGNDILAGGTAIDEIHGGGGEDVILAAFEDESGDKLYGGSGADVFDTNNGDIIYDIESGDRRVNLDSKRVIGGERKQPPRNPCVPLPSDGTDEDIAYKGADGTLYVLSGTTLRITNPASSSITLHNFQNGDAGIRLRPSRPNQKQAECQRDPLILDLNGDRQVVRELFDSTSYFDLDNDGFAERVAWTMAGDGFLAIDRDGNGSIDSGSELFGSGRSEFVHGRESNLGTDGFAELSDLDTNRDYRITAADVSFDALRVWIDVNGDGTTDEGELKALSELGIVSIGLNLVQSNNEDCGCDGTNVTFMSNVTKSDGSTFGIYDTFLAIDQYDTIEVGPLQVPAEIRSLPFLMGSGTLSDLDVAMTRDAALEEMVRQFAELDVTKADQIATRVEQIILRWTGADMVPSNGRGVSIDGQWLAAIEKITGSDFYQAQVGSNPRTDAAAMLIKDWQSITHRVTAQLLGQTALGRTLLPDLTFASAAFYQATEGVSVSAIIENLSQHAPIDKVGQLTYWHSTIGALLEYSQQLSLSDDDIYAAINASGVLTSTSLTAQELAALNFDTSSIGFVPDSAPSRLISIRGNEALLASSDGEMLVGSRGDNRYIVSRDTSGVVLKDDGGTDTLFLLDQNRSDIIVNSSLATTEHSTEFSTIFDINVSLSNLAGDWSLDLKATVIDGKLITSIETVDFADEKHVSITSLLPSTIAKPDGSGFLYFGADDSANLAGGAGDDFIVGSGTADHYRIGEGSGDDVIADIADTLSTGDKLYVDALLSDVSFEIGGVLGTDLIIRTGADQTTTVLGEWLSQTSIELFTFADSLYLTADEVRSKLTTGNANDETIKGTIDDDVMDGVGGQDVLAGGFGNDTYRFVRGYGQLTVDDPLGLNIIAFGDIGSSEITLSQTDSKTLLSVAGSDDVVVINGRGSTGKFTFQFADRTLTLDELLLEQASRTFVRTDGMILGTDHDDFYLEGTDENDVVNGLGGYETLYGYLGDDTYIYTGGTKEIEEDGGFDVIRASTQFSFETVILLAGAIKFEGNDGEILIDNLINSDGTSSSNRTYENVEGLVFADGRSINLAGGAIDIGNGADNILFNFGSQDTVFTPGKGNDRIFASETYGIKTVRLERDFGHDVFYQGNIFKIDLSAYTLDSSIAFARRGDDLIISTDDGANDITLKVAFDPFYDYVQSSVQFAGGVTLNLAAIGQQIAVTSSGNDLLFGRSILNGGTGDDTLIGNNVANEYHYAVGSGNDVIKERGWGFGEHDVQDTLILGGLNLSDVTFERHPDDHKSILMTLKASGETLIIDGTPFDDFRSLRDSDNAPNGVDRSGAHWIDKIIFADGTIRSQRDIEQQILDSEKTSGNETLVNFGAPDPSTNIAGAYLDGGAGDDHYINDFENVFVKLSAGSGRNVLSNTRGFSATTVKLDGIADSDILVRTEVREGVLYTVLYAKDGSSLAIEGTSTSSVLTLKIVGQSGQVYSTFQDGPIIGGSNGTAGDDYLKGALTGPITTAFARPDPINDLLTPGAGNDVIAGYGGNDIVRFGRGDGTDLLLDSRLLGASRNKVQSYTIEFAADVQRSEVDVAWADDGSGLIRVSIRGTEDSILLAPQNFGALKFVDGSLVQTADTGNGAEIINFATLRPTATAGDDVLFALPGETISGGAGNDTIYYVPNAQSFSYAKVEFGPGSGSDYFSNRTQPTIINDRYVAITNTRHDLVLANINSLDEVRLLREADTDDLIVEIIATGERLTIADQFKVNRNDEPQWVIQNIILATGERIWWPYAQGRLIEGGLSGSDEISTGSDGGVLDGMAGNDTLRGSTGDDSYIFGRAYDEDIIQDAGGRDSVLFEEGVSASDVYFSRTGIDGNDLLIEVMGLDRLSLTIRNQFDLASSKIESFRFADGETLNWADVQAFILDTQSRTLDDVIDGFASNDDINSLAGNDRITGSRGDDEIDGGMGRDLATYSGAVSEYEIATADGVTTVRDLVEGRDGTDTLRNIEDLKFLGGGTTLSLVAPNTVPTAGTMIFDGSEDNDIVIARPTLLALASDADGDALSLSISGSPTGRAWIDLDGNIRFRPNANFNGEGYFDYAVTDGNGGRATARITVNVAASNDAPVVSVAISSVAFDEDQPVAFEIPVSTFTDADGDALSITVQLADGSPLPGWLTYASGRVTGTPPSNFNGALDLVAIANDGAATAQAAFTLVVRPRNDAPTVTTPIPDSEVAAGAALSIAIPASNFADVDGDALQVSVVQADGSPLPGWLSFVDGQLQGVAPSDFTGVLNLRAVAFDGRSRAIEDFSLIAPTNRAPVVQNPLADVTVDEDVAIDIALPIDAFSDADGDSLTYSARLTSGAPLPGWLAFVAGRFTGTPPSDFNGVIDIEVIANDGQMSASDIFQLTISPINDAPILTRTLADVTSPEDAPFDLVLPSDTFSDIDGDTLTLTARNVDGTSLPAWLTFAEGHFTGTPPVNFNGSLDIVVTGTDASTSISDTFRLTIDPVNDAPVLLQPLTNVTHALATPIDISIPVNSFGDVDGDTLSFSANLDDGNPLPAWLSMVDGHLVGTAPAAGEFDIRITASDGMASASDTFRLTIEGGNRPPVAVDDALFLVEGGVPLTILASSLLENDSDPDGNALTIQSVSNSQNGSVGIDASGNIIFTPSFGYEGAGSFQYTITDGTMTAAANVTINMRNAFNGWWQGTEDKDVLHGNHTATNRIYGLGGNDNIKGGKLTDWLAGGDGDDHLNGWEGDDHLYGMAGNDKLQGGLGFDTAYFWGLRSDYVLTTVSGELQVSLSPGTPTTDGDDGVDTLTGIERLSFKNGETISVVSPIILDLDGDGEELVSAANSSALFDVDGDGTLDDTSWVGTGDGFLFIDRDGNGTVSGANELSFTGDVANARSDLDGLRSFDSNGDGSLSLADQSFGRFRIWEDRNGNGAADAAEILTLDAAGIVSLDLAGQAVEGAYAFGEVAIVNRGRFVRNDGSAGGFVDAALSFVGSARPELPEIEIDARSFNSKAKNCRIRSVDGQLYIGPKKLRGSAENAADLLEPASLLSFTNGSHGLLARVILDLDGDGLELRSSKQSRARFDMNGDGALDETGWVGKGDGLLVIDRDGDGLITHASELSLLAENPNAPSDLAALESLDNNADGNIDAQDVRFRDLKVWIDRNDNGVTDNGELQGLDALGIASISLADTAVDQTVKVGQNLLMATSTFTRADGTTGSVGDVVLAYTPGKPLPASAKQAIVDRLAFRDGDDERLANMMSAFGEDGVFGSRRGIISSKSSADADLLVSRDLPAISVSVEFDNVVALMRQDLSVFGLDSGELLDRLRNDRGYMPIDIFAAAV